ncbi:MAG: DUF86 domain-containing protein [Deltaproteobacteria bacterium]|nr:DUF86 domain-containing protein [Deltaproteobacteria bacterium]
MVDKNMVLRKLSAIDDYLQQIREFSGIAIDEYKSDWKSQRIVERTLQIMIETCADIANHLISDRNMRIPASYSDTFKVLFENKAIDKDLFAVMEKMAKFRNIVVHQYEEVDAEIVIIILRKHLDDFIRFKEAILSSL